MRLDSIFSGAFIAAVAKLLNERCQNGGLMSRGEVCDELGLPREGGETIVSLLLSQKMLPGFVMRGGGRFGGIAKEGVRRTKQHRFDSNFLSVLTQALEKMVPIDPKQTVKRALIARAMNSIDSTIFGGSETEAEISLALNAWQVPGFGCKPGLGGGVCRTTYEQYQARQATKAARKNIVDEVTSSGTKLPAESAAITEPALKRNQSDDLRPTV